MTSVELSILGIVIGSNNFAVALTLVALGLKGYCYRVMFVFGLFEFALPLGSEYRRRRPGEIFKGATSHAFN